MKESTTYQATLEEGRQEGLQEGLQKGRREEAIRLLLQLAQKSLGKPSAAIRAQLDLLSDVSDIEALIERMNDVTSWPELISLPTTSTRKSRKKKS